MVLRLFSIATLALAAFACSAAADAIDPAQAIAQKFFEASQAKPDAKKAERPSLDYEMDMLRRARAEEAEREQLDATRATPAAAQPAAVIQPAAAAPVPAVAVAPTAAPLPATPAVAEKTIERAPPPPAPIAPAPDAASEIPANVARATILLVLEGDRSDAVAVARPDPIVCLDDRCWLSNGIEAPARPMPRSMALALKSSDHETSDSCSGKSACVFRNIAIGPDARIEVAELGEGHGATGNAFSIAADTTCRKDAGELVCDNGLVTHDFRVWVVPETTAQAVGSSGLEEAVVSGLPEVDGQSANDK